MLQLSTGQVGHEAEEDSDGILPVGSVDNLIGVHHEIDTNEVPYTAGRANGRVADGVWKTAESIQEDAD